MRRPAPKNLGRLCSGYPAMQRETQSECHLRKWVEWDVQVRAREVVSICGISKRGNQQHPGECNECE
jgi:hypothetical protein